MDELKVEQFVPVDKSWVIRLGVLDILSGQDTIKRFVDAQPDDNIPDDVRHTRLAAEDWPENRSICVGESGTLLRALQFAAWSSDANRHFVKKGTLAERDICDNPEIVRKSARQLLRLDNGTSQWATAAVLNGSRERIDDPPYKLAVTYEAVEHWQEAREAGEPWEPRADETILKQAQAFTTYLTRGEKKFEPRHSEDYCFARAFGLITAGEGKKRWPSLKGHESNRIAEMEEGIKLLGEEGRIISRDHRVVQALGLMAVSTGLQPKIDKSNVVNKSWPRFWGFYHRSRRLIPKV